MASSPQKCGASTLVAAACVALVLAWLFWRYPLFHVVSLKQAQQQQAAAFNAETFARTFWDAQLLPAVDRAHDLNELLTALAADPSAARKKYGRSLGLSSTAAVFIKGAGKVAAVEEEAVVVALEGTSGARQVRLATGLLFGNAVRDGTGLLDVSAYSDSQHFNDLSTELNRIVETKISPALREKAAVGKAIRFAGCVELEEEAAVENLQIVPVKVEWP
jgi:predicted lipoprotein